ncbi:MAG TPA: hypothetical protein VK824_00135, partial [Planctomycetota bacterium]|nr:hypothetical protein [Planctomycetota bacterium]
MADIPQRKSINRTHGSGPPHGEFHVVGRRVRKVDGIHKATGQAVYADDIALPGMLHAKTLRSPHAHALIRGIDASAALALPGVHAVITGRDLPITYGVIPWTQDENALAVEKVRFIGDEVAAVRWRNYRLYPKEFGMTSGNPAMTGLAGRRSEGNGFPAI